MENCLTSISEIAFIFPSSDETLVIFILFDNVLCDDCHSKNGQIEQMWFNEKLYAL